MNELHNPLDMGYAFEVKSPWRIVILLSSCALILLVFHFQERDRYQCKECLAEQQVRQWRIGLWPLSMPLASKQTTISCEQFGHDTLGAGHFHNWQFAQGSPYAWFGTKWYGCALGRYREECWVRIYAERAEFRQFVQAEIEDGKITKQQIVEGFLGTSKNPKESDRRMLELLDRFLDQPS